MIRLSAAFAVLIALTALSIPDKAGAGDETGDGAYCLWYKLQAMKSGEEYWWDRWRRWLRGDDWDRPRVSPRR
jgi:hypothetical protein